MIGLRRRLPLALIVVALLTTGARGPDPKTAAAPSPTQVAPASASTGLGPTASTADLGTALEWLALNDS